MILISKYPTKKYNRLPSYLSLKMIALFVLYSRIYDVFRVIDSVCIINFIIIEPIFK